jgi:hypothetical protein
MPRRNFVSFAVNEWTNGANNSDRKWMSDGNPTPWKSLWNGLLQSTSGANRLGTWLFWMATLKFCFCVMGCWRKLHVRDIVSQSLEVRAMQLFGFISVAISRASIELLSISRETNEAASLEMSCSPPFLAYHTVQCCYRLSNTEKRGVGKRITRIVNQSFYL